MFLKFDSSNIIDYMVEVVVGNVAEVVVGKGATEVDFLPTSSFYDIKGIKENAVANRVGADFHIQPVLSVNEGRLRPKKSKKSEKKK